MSHLCSLRLRYLARKARSLESILECKLLGNNVRVRNVESAERRGYALMASRLRIAQEGGDEYYYKGEENFKGSNGEETRLKSLGLILSGLGLAIALVEHPNNLLGEHRCSNHVFYSVCSELFYLILFYRKKIFLSSTVWQYP